MTQYVASVIRSRRGDGPELTVSGQKLTGPRRQQPEPSPPLEAALATLSWYHARLLDLRPGPIERELAYDLTWKRDWALFALIEHGTGGWAKEQQVEITGGKPLAICTGSDGG